MFEIGEVRMNKIGAVIVTYNRLEKLKNALTAYEAQIVQPDYILVVDNNSTDGTSEYLKQWMSQDSPITHEVLTLEKNMGGSGGFYAGIKAALEKDIAWLWVADDDAYPENTCLQRMIAYISSHKMEQISALCASVCTNGKIALWHRRRFIKRYGLVLDEQRISEKEYEKAVFSLDLFSYVGSLMKTSAVKKAGLPEKDFFIAYDDSEHSIRMRKQGQILCLPDAKVIHDTPDTDDTKITWKKYYTLRNKVYSYRKHFGVLQGLFQECYFLLKNRKNNTLFCMTKQAMDDAKKEILGQHTLYRPGWKEEKGY